MNSSSVSPKRRIGMAVSAALACGLLLAACSAEPIHPEAVGIEKVNMIDWRVHRHPVQFAWGTATPEPGEMERLADFLAPYDEGAGAYVFVDAGAGVTGDALARQRLQRVHGVISSRGFTLRKLPQDPAGLPATASDPRMVSVFLGEYVVTAPDCPDMRKQTSADFTNTPASDFGCSTVTNLGLMVANPSDLVVGRDPGPADAERAVLGVQRYRKPPAKKDGTEINTVSTTGAQQ